MLRGFPRIGERLAVVAVPEHLAFAWRAFWELSSDRSVGFGVGPIPFTAIARYADRYGVGERDAFERFLELIRGMDAAYLKDTEERREREARQARRR